MPDDLWARLFENAIDNVGILVYSGFFLAEQHSRKIELLKKKADDGQHYLDDRSGPFLG